MIRLAFQNLLRRPMRLLLTLFGLAAAIAVLLCLTAFGQGYQHALRAELNQMGLQLMLVPLGCPYDAAARVLKGKNLETSLPDSVVIAARADPAVAVAAPLLMVAVARPREGRTDMWVGLEETALELKPWWQMKSGSRWFLDADSVILGADAAAVELRAPGDKFYSPEAGRALRVAGVLNHSGTSDDSLFFVPLATAQRMFEQPGRLTAVAIRLRDPALLRDAAERLQKIPGAQVVTITEMMGAFLNLVGAARSLLLALGIVALTVSALSVFNTLLAAVVERAGELSLMRAVGASRAQIFGLVTLESLLLTGAGSAGGLALTALLGNAVESVMKRLVPFAPAESLLAITTSVVLQCLGLAAAVGALAAIYPAWQASRLQPADAARRI